MELTLTRFLSNEHRTMGVLTLPGVCSFATLECPWVPAVHHDYGTPGTSCLPPGRYDLVRTQSPTFSKHHDHRDMYYIACDDVPVRRTFGRPRFATLFHVGNTEDDVRGCVALGLTMAARADRVVHSRKAVNRFLDALDVGAMDNTLQIVHVMSTPFMRRANGGNPTSPTLTTA